MRISKGLIANLKKLIDKETVAYSSIPESLVNYLLSEGLLRIVAHKSKRSLICPDPDALVLALSCYDDSLRDFVVTEEIFDSDWSRASQAARSGNSKIRGVRSCPGFLVNAYDPQLCSLRGEIFNLNSKDGSAVYIADWETFIPSTDTLIVGIENMENFLRIREQRDLFAKYLQQNEAGILFVARYALSSDLMKWLEMIPNRYLHFGDFDLAGIAIYQREFLPRVADRGSFLIPSDIETRISCGSRERYNAQYQKYCDLKSENSELQDLISIINKYRRTYDQEGYIGHPLDSLPQNLLMQGNGV